MKQRIYRLLQVILATVVLFAILFGWHLLHDPDRFPIHSVKVQASYAHLDKQTLAAVITPFVNNGFFNLNARKLQEQLQRTPWVAEATVNRIWPDTIVIRIVEQKAVARWGNQQLIDEKGQLFTPAASTFPSNLPIFNSTANIQAATLLQMYQQMQIILAPLDFRIVQLDADDRQALSLTLANGTKIILGLKDPLRRLQRFVKVYPNIVTSHESVASVIDLRYENGLAIQWQAPQKTVALPTDQKASAASAEKKRGTHGNL